MPSICLRIKLTSQYRFSDILFPPLGGLPGLARSGPTDMTLRFISLSGIRKEERSSPDASPSASTILWNCATTLASMRVGRLLENAFK